MVFMSIDPDNYCPVALIGIVCDSTCQVLLKTVTLITRISIQETQMGWLQKEEERIETDSAAQW